MKEASQPRARRATRAGRGGRCAEGRGGASDRGPSSPKRMGLGTGGGPCQPELRGACADPSATKVSAFGYAGPHLLTLAGNEGDFRLVDLFIALTEQQFPVVAQRIGTEQQYREAMKHAHYLDVLTNWRAAQERHLIKTHGESVAKQKFAGFYADDDDLETPLYPILSVPVTAKDAQQAFFDALKNPSIQLPKALSFNWPIVSNAAKRGDMAFFKHMADAMRRPKKKMGVPNTQEYLLHYWLPGALWKKSLSLQQIADALGSFTQRRVERDAVKQAIKRAGLLRFQ